MQPMLERTCQAQVDWLSRVHHRPQNRLFQHSLGMARATCLFRETRSLWRWCGCHWHSMETEESHQGNVLSRWLREHEGFPDKDKEELPASAQVHAWIPVLTFSWCLKLHESDKRSVTVIFSKAQGTTEGGRVQVSFRLKHCWFQACFWEWALSKQTNESSWHEQDV